MHYQDILLGVNIDHVATLRQVRGTRYPEVLHAAHLAENAGADGITVHLREDRRHIQDRDVELLAQALDTRLNLEIAVTEEMLMFAERIKPTYVCLVPERREELTTEGGLDVCGQADRIKDACTRLAEAGIQVSLFIDPDKKQIAQSAECGAPIIELHTGDYAEAQSEVEQVACLSRLETAVDFGIEAGLQVNAGHGLHYHNVIAVAKLAGITELNIGHAIVARALFCGFVEAVKTMKQLMQQARQTSG